VVSVAGSPSSRVRKVSVRPSSSPWLNGHTGSTWTRPVEGSFAHFRGLFLPTFEELRVTVTAVHTP